MVCLKGNKRKFFSLEKSSLTKISYSYTDFSFSSEQSKMWFLILGVISFGVVYYWFSINYRFFVDRKIPGPKPKFPFGNHKFHKIRNMIYDLDDIYKFETLAKI
jgi:hypothetical protein